MTGRVTTSAARAGGAGLELVRMLATFVWVAGATVVDGRGARRAARAGSPAIAATVRRAATVQDAERRLGARILVPGYFPDRLDWPPKCDPGGGRPPRLGPARPRARDGGPDLHILQATREGEPIAPELLDGPDGAPDEPHHRRLAHPATLSDVLVDGTLHRELAWEVQGRAMILRSSGDVEELFRMARTSHREGGR